MYLQTLAILLSFGNTFSDFLSVLDDCKYWSYLKVYENEEKKTIHCILDQNFKSGLVYTEWKIIPKGFCPIYNRFARQIDSIPCNLDIGICPNESVYSYSGVTYTGCYDAIRKQTNVMKPTTNENVHVPPADSDNGNYAAPSVIIATLSACINCMFIIVCVWHFICRSKIKLCRDEYGMPRVDKTPDHIATEPEPGIGAKGNCGMAKMKGGENEVLDASKLAVIMYQKGSRGTKRRANRKSKPAKAKNEVVEQLRAATHVTYRKSKSVDGKVQEDHCSRPTSDTYSQVSSADSKTSEDNLVHT